METAAYLTTHTGPPSPKRDAIMAAALELFAERGFHGTPVPLVAEKAGVGAGTIYRYFPSKEALVNALYQTWKSALGRRLLDGFPADAPVREQFHAFWSRIAAFATENPKAFAFLELHHHAPYLDDRSRAIEMELLMSIAAFLEATTRKQVTKDLPPAVLIAIAYGAFLGVMKGHWTGHLPLTPEVLDAAEACVWEAIRR